MLIAFCMARKGQLHVMYCAKRLQLERKHQEASASLDAAVKKLHERIGICPKDEFMILRLNLDAAWCALERARIELAQHRHCCLNASGLPAYVERTNQLNSRAASGAL